MLRVVDDAIAMHALLWPDEVRAPEGVAPDVDVTIRDKELDLADALMDTLGEVEMADLHDEYREALEEVIAAKAAGEAPPQAPEPAKGGKVLDLMAALENSVRAARESREPTGEAEVRPLPDRRSTPKETGTKKSTSTARKTTAKKTAARKSTSKSTETAKKSTARSSTARSGTARSGTAKSGTGKKTAAKKTAARKRSA